MGRPPSYQCYVADRLHCVQCRIVFSVSPIFPFFNTISVKRSQTLFVAKGDILWRIENG